MGSDKKVDTTNSQIEIDIKLLIAPILAKYAVEDEDVNYNLFDFDQETWKLTLHLTEQTKEQSK